MESGKDHERLADELEQLADQLGHESKRLEEKIGEARTDWEAKRRDPAVPGAPAPAQGEEQDRDADSGHGDGNGNEGEGE